MSAGLPKKSNAMRLLEARGIPYQAYTYALEIRSAEAVARVLGVPAPLVYKTLVVLPPRGKALLAVVPATHTLDLKRLAQAIGEKKLRMATQREAEALTGLQVGGISALALLERGFTVYIDRAAEHAPELIVSAGQRGLNLRLRTADFLRLTGARIVAMAVATAPADGT
jgi:Cys-tRNA(Pro)/Cys-tRNA(Cys) deacylase